MNPHLDFLLSGAYAHSTLHPEHLGDLRKSGLSDETINNQKIRSVPPDMIDRLLGFEAPRVRHAYVIPFAHPRGGWMNHVRLKIFPGYEDRRGNTVKYLGPRGAAPRLFFPIVTLEPVCHGDAPLDGGGGAKKALSVAQLGRSAVGFEGVECWHEAGSRALLSDFDYLRLRGRTVELVPDGDVRTNPNVTRAVERFVDALQARGATVRVVLLPAVAA